MKKRISLFAVVACTLGALALVLAGCGGGASSSAASGSAPSESGSPAASDSATSDGSYKLVSEGTLTCVSEIGFAPFEYMEEGSTEPVGYDIDVANEVAKRMGLTCKFLPSQKFDTLLTTISEGSKADVAVAGITIQADRAKTVDFSDPYYSSNQALIIKKGSGETLQSLNAKDKKVACQLGTTGDGWISENIPNADKKALDDVAAGLAGVSTGTYNAYVIDLPVAEKQLKDYTDLEIVEKIATGEEYGIAVSKKNPELTKAINEALEEMKSDGTLDKIAEKWLSKEATSA